MPESLTIEINHQSVEYTIWTLKKQTDLTADDLLPEITRQVKNNPHVKVQLSIALKTAAKAAIEKLEGETND